MIDQDVSLGTHDGIFFFISHHTSICDVSLFMRPIMMVINASPHDDSAHKVVAPTDR